eukprot:2455049-Pyramimonas_sp.AAC.1
MRGLAGWRTSCRLLNVFSFVSSRRVFSRKASGRMQFGSVSARGCCSTFSGPRGLQDGPREPRDAPKT